MAWNDRKFDPAIPATCYSCDLSFRRPLGQPQDWCPICSRPRLVAMRLRNAAEIKRTSNKAWLTPGPR